MSPWPACGSCSLEIESACEAPIFCVKNPQAAAACSWRSYLEKDSVVLGWSSKYNALCKDAISLELLLLTLGIASEEKRLFAYFVKDQS